MSKIEISKQEFYEYAIKGVKFVLMVVFGNTIFEIISSDINCIVMSVLSVIILMLGAIYNGLFECTIKDFKEKYKKEEK